jgi:uncharacterized membrane protein
MVGKRLVGGVLVGAAAVFGAALYLVIRGLSGQGQVLGCMDAAPGCAGVVAGLSASHVAVGLISAVGSLGLYFLLFHRDVEGLVAAEQKALRLREERIELIGTMMTPGERALLSVLLKEDGIMQSTLSYRTNLTPGRVSQVLAGFEERGLVRRTPAGRSFRVHLAV